MQQQHVILENLFRYEYSKIIAVLLSRFGPSHIESIEDAVQDALLKAMQIWGFKNIPENPTSWLLRVAHNGLIDMLRRSNKIVAKEVLHNVEESNPLELSMESTISDSQLKMIFACCHPALSVDYQIILSLKLIGGFGNKEIAKALLKKEESVAKSFTRAKKQLKTKITTLDIPVGMGLQSRLAVVLKVIYLLFSEGYAPSSGSQIIKRDICMEAIRLALLLSENKYSNHPNVPALIALMCFHASRFEARLDENFELVDLEHQDRSKYNSELIKIGIRNLENSGTSNYKPSNYHLEAAVSYHHCVARSFESTDWNRILYLYDLQLHSHYSPIVQLNRIIPYYKVHGAQKAIAELHLFERSPYFLDNALYYAIKAELLSELKRWKEAKSPFLRAIDRTENELEKKHFVKKLQMLGKRI